MSGRTAPGVAGGPVVVSLAKPHAMDSMLQAPPCLRITGRMLRRFAGLQLAAWLGAASLGAQTTDQRRALDSFRDTLSTVTDTMTLRLQEVRLLATAQRFKVDAFSHLRLGHLALRQGDLGGATHYDDAASEFKWASELAPAWPYAWYGLGLAEFALGARSQGPGGRHPVLARDAWSRATQAFARAAVLEPGFAARLETLARRAVRGHTPDEAAIVREALRRATQDGRGPRLARLLLALGRVQRETGDSGALATFQGYLELGDDRALGLVELGRTRLMRGDRGAAVMYLEGAGVDDPMAVAEVRADLQPIATEEDLADFDLRRGAARQEMVRRFWGSRDRLELRQEGERLAEHLRRLDVARREFLLVSDDGTERLDDRGRVYVRHGVPDDRASFTQAGVEPNESWRYHRGRRDIVLHFVARQAPNDFRLVESVFDVSDVRRYLADAAVAPSSGAASAGADQLLRSRATLADMYQRVPAGRPGQVADFLAREREMGREGIRVGTLSDSYTLRFPHELSAWGSVVVAGGSGAEPAVQVLFAIPGYAIAPATGVIGIVYPVRVRFVALDSSGTVVASVDSILRLEPGDPIAANRSLVGRIAVPIRPGRVVTQAAVLYGEDAGTAFGVDTMTVPSPGGDALALGDILIGSPHGRLSVPLGEGLSLPITPGGVASRSDGAELAIEIFGLAPGGAASMRVMVAPAGEWDGGGAERWRSFPGVSNDVRVVRGPGQGPIVRSRVMLPLRKLKPGSWSVAVVVTDGAGRMARREGPLTVLVP